MKLTLAEPKYLKESITIISDLVNEARFKITKDAIELVAMDPANVAMVLFKLLSRTFNLPLIDLEEKEQKIPDLKFPVSINMPTGIFNEAIQDADVVAESVTFLAEPKKFTVHAEGDLSEVKIEIKKEKKTKGNIDKKEKIREKNSIKNLKKMIN